MGLHAVLYPFRTVTFLMSPNTASSIPEHIQHARKPDQFASRDEREGDHTTCTMTKEEDASLRREFRHVTEILASLANVNSDGRQVLDPTIDEIFNEKVPLVVDTSAESPVTRALIDALCILLVRTTENVSLTSFPSDDGPGPSDHDHEG